MDTYVHISTALAVLILIASVYLYMLQVEDSRVEEDKKPSRELAVCVLSARDHFSERDSLRATWVGEANSNPALSQRVQVWFVVGDRDCDMAPEDREDVFGCVPKPLPPEAALSGSLGDIAAFSLIETADVTPLHMASSRIAVKVFHSVVLKRIGIPEFLPFEQGLTVTLILGNQSEVLQDSEEFLRVKFGMVDTGIRHQGFRYQPVNALPLHQVGPSQLTSPVMSLSHIVSATM